MAGFTVAVIDMGSNSFRLQVSDVFDGTYKVLEDYKEVLRLGDDVYKNGKFSDAAIQSMMATLKNMKVIMDNMKVQHKRVVGTALFRDASNTPEVVHLIKREMDLDVDVISGDEEARLIYLAATGNFDLGDKSTLLTDIGGGSTELSYVVNGDLVDVISTPLGCSRITQTFVKKNKARNDEIEKMKQHIEEVLCSLFPPGGIDRIIFTGGTVNALAQVYVRRSNMADSAVKYVDTIFFNHLIKELAGKSYENRAKISGLETDRADISLAAALIVQFLLKHYGLSGFYAFSGGLRNGLTIDLLNTLGLKLLFQEEKIPDVRYSKLVETGRKYNYEEEHSLHVTMLAKKLFEGLYDVMKLSLSDWRLLEAAAVLHDIGQHISYAKHHKHSYYLIKNTELAGYSEREQEIIANIAKYHRRAVPKKEDKPYGSLPASDRAVIRGLAAILRVADGLDRSHVSAVNELETVVTNNEIIITVHSDKDISMEMTGVAKKKDLIEDITGRSLLLVQGQ